MENDIAIKVEDLSKTFKLPHERQSSVKGALINFHKHRSYEKQQVLNDISFEVKKGEFFGIAGRNGSGKSTLLKILAGIYSPTAGSIEIKGTLVPFIELGVGFNQELTGRENVFLNGALLGFNRKQMFEMYDDIVKFAELEKFMDQKLKNYSSGMQVRLAFSIAIRAHSDILLIDEVLAVGDESFKRKCLEYFEQIKLEGKTVIFISHDMNAVRQFCDRAALVNSGKIIEIGKPDYIAERYAQINLESNQESLQKVNNSIKINARRFGNRKAEILDIWTTDKDGKTKDSFTPNEIIVANVKIEAKADLKDNAFGIVFKAQDDKNIFATNSIAEKTKVPSLAKGEKVLITVEVENIFNDGFYTISSAITDISRKDIYSRVLDMHRFEVGGWELTTALTHPSNKIKSKVIKNK